MLRNPDTEPTTLEVMKREVDVTEEIIDESINEFRIFRLEEVIISYDKITSPSLNNFTSFINFLN
ncbi:hypothetical protein A2686_02785 [Candidatus Woesebacteria bacterium RIFCSPHIGHO2_01_FULL_38_10]|uniref:Uncharacterized protein n=1 Tax=Candidatus Woesebacteria bacterium RIFCSPLOWO2_01_FULL_39_10b TaxID=1802517 RepID=A0A1F8B8Z0_9BACT|nr:MAG: hypothetical protein A2686_02785 [Candidatus Woesebacteria bacterium RIFCSPHIGHO2_01_FULL_38_10]OGM60491.1 MAG: hypothetical protein A2892_00480 [Candidatus Woesebacteria bacterium RIFCSPLOWO2_01_FULL_39_10b]